MEPDAKPTEPAAEKPIADEDGQKPQDTSGPEVANPTETPVVSDSFSGSAHEPFDVDAAEAEEPVAVDMPKTLDDGSASAAVFGDTKRGDHSRDVEWPPKPQTESVANGSTASNQDVAQVGPDDGIHTGAFAAAASVDDDALPSFRDSSGVAAPEKPRGGKKKWIIGGIVILLIILLAAAYVFAIYLPGRPGAVYSASLKRTGLAVDKLISYDEKQDPNQYQGAAVTGSATINGKNYALDGNFDSSYDKTGNSSSHLGVDAEITGNTNRHVVAGFDLRTLMTKGQTYPDVYFRVTGIDSLLESAGLDQASSTLDQYDGKWIEVTHELIGQYADQYASQNSGNKVQQPTQAQIDDATNKVQAVNKKYLFTDDSATAVLVKKQFVGAETKYGRRTYHYKMGYNKAHLLSYIDAVGKALDSSKLNDWSQKVYKKDLSQEVKLADVKQSVQKQADPNYTFDMWTDRKTRLIEALQFQDNQKDNASSITFAQMYDGGTKYPFRIDVSGNDHGDEGSATLEATVDSASSTATLNLNYDDNNNGDKTTIKGNLKITPSKSSVNVTKPDKSQTLQSVLDQLGLGDVLGGTNQNSGVVSQSAAESEAQTVLAEAKGKLLEYQADNTGKFPVSQAAFASWLKSAAGDKDEAFATTFTVKNGYSYVATPVGCNNLSKKCTGFTATASKSIWHGTKDLTVTN